MTRREISEVPEQPDSQTQILFCLDPIRLKVEKFFLISKMMKSRRKKESGAVQIRIRKKVLDVLDHYSKWNHDTFHEKIFPS